MNKQLTIDELRAYQAGQLDGPARHRVERLLLEDPFYADALEGLEALQRTGASLPKQTAQLRQALHERISESATERRLFPLWVTTMAASIVLVMGVALYFIFTNDVRKPVVLAPQKSVTEPIEIDMGPQHPSAIQKTVDAVAAIEKHQGQQRTPSRINTNAPIALSKREAAPETNASNGSIIELEPAVLTHTDNNTDVTSVAVAALDEPTFNPRRIAHPERAFGPNPPAAPDEILLSENRLQLVQSQLPAPISTNPMPGLPASGRVAQSSVQFTNNMAPPARPMFTVQGQVIDRQGNPLPGVSIVIKGLSRGTTTDARGQFSLDSTLIGGKPLIASYIGFQSREFPTSVLANGPLQLTEDTQALNEVMIVGYNAASKGPLPAAAVAINPVDQRNFDDFIRQHGQTSLLIEPITVDFTTNSQGKAQRIRIQKAPNPAAEAEAIRLVQSYTKWPTNQFLTVAIRALVNK